MKKRRNDSARQLLESLGDIDERYLAETEPQETIRTMHKNRYIAVAACAAVALVGAAVGYSLLSSPEPPLVDRPTVIKEADKTAAEPTAKTEPTAESTTAAKTTTVQIEKTAESTQSSATTVAEPTRHGTTKAPDGYRTFANLQALSYFLALKDAGDDDLQAAGIDVSKYRALTEKLATHTFFVPRNPADFTVDKISMNTDKGLVDIVYRYEGGTVEFAQVVVYGGGELELCGDAVAAYTVGEHRIELALAQFGRYYEGVVNGEELYYVFLHRAEGAEELPDPDVLNEFVSIPLFTLNDVLKLNDVLD